MVVVVLEVVLVVLEVVLQLLLLQLLLLQPLLLQLCVLLKLPSPFGRRTYRLHLLCHESYHVGMKSILWLSGTESRS